MGRLPCASDASVSIPIGNLISNEIAEIAKESLRSKSTIVPGIV